jgi:bile acid:Na+ symporter, BASS family
MQLFNRLFPLWALLFAAGAYWYPQLFVGHVGLIVPLLALVMFFMGLTLGADDFKRLLRSPRPVAIGVGLQFLLMPLLAWLLAHALQLPEQLAVGLILVGCCSGGTASNVICYLARGNVALSITMTMVSTIVGVVATPLLVGLYIERAIEVDRLAMLLSIVKMVLAPVAAGVAVNFFLAHRIKALEPLLAALSIIAIALIIAIIVAVNGSGLAKVGMLTLLAVALHNTLGLAGAYGCCRLLGMDLRDSRSIAIEVGMQNSGLGVALALKYFSAMAALPAALFSIWHNLAGALLAGVWRSSAESIVSGPSSRGDSEKANPD